MDGRVCTGLKACPPPANNRAAQWRMSLCRSPCGASRCRAEIAELAGEFKGDPLAHQRVYLRAVENRRSDGDEIALPALLTIHDQLAVIGGAGCGKSALAQSGLTLTKPGKTKNHSP